MTDIDLIGNGSMIDDSVMEGIDQDTIELAREFGKSFPILQWAYGNAALKKVGGMDYMGGWFFSIGPVGKAEETDEQKAKKATIAAAMAKNGWAPATWTDTEGRESQGMWRREIAIAYVYSRKRWEVKGADKKTLYFPWDNYNEAAKLGKASGRMHALVIVKGLEEIGPMVLTLKGTAEMYFEGTGKNPGALQALTKNIITPANADYEAKAKASGREVKKYAPRVFWLPVGADREADGTPKYTKSGKGDETRNLVVPIALGMPADKDGWKKFYVGAEVQKMGNEIYTDNLEWRKAWDSFTDNAGESDTHHDTPKTAAKEVESNKAALDNLGL